MQPTGASLDDLIPAIKVFNGLVKEGIPRSKLVFSLSRVGTEAEEIEARNYIEEAGYETLAVEAIFQVSNLLNYLIENINLLINFLCVDWCWPSETRQELLTLCVKYCVKVHR